MDTVLAVVLVGALVAGGLVVLVMMLRRLADRAEAAVRAELGAAKVVKLDRAANFFGVESKGLGQLRGNGVLVLTDRELRYRMWAPARTVAVPLSSVVRAERVGSHLAKSRGTPLLKVVFTSEAGVEDSVAWQVREPADAWIAEIERRIGGG